MQFDKKEYDRKFDEYVKDDRIVKSSQAFKIKLFLNKAENSLSIAEYHKNIKPCCNEFSFMRAAIKTHYDKSQCPHPHDFRH